MSATTFRLAASTTVSVFPGRARVPWLATSTKRLSGVTIT